MVVDEPVPPIRKVMAEGTAIIVEAAVGPYLENGEMSIWNKIGTHHTGPKYRESYHTRASTATGCPSEPCWTIKIVPRKLTDLAGPRVGEALLPRGAAGRGRREAVVQPKY